MNSKPLAIIDQHTELMFLRKRFEAITAESEAEQVRLQNAFNAFVRDQDEKIKDLWREAGDYLIKHGLLPANFKQFGELRMEGDALIVLLDPKSKHRDCDCPVCVIGRIFGGKH